MGIAQLRWTRPAAYLAVRAVDHGEDAAARGVVHTQDGRPFSYEVAPEDQLASVAARFGLTPEELVSLNPRRQRTTSTILDVDEVLTLDIDDR